MDVHVKGDVADKAASGGCSASPCSHSFISCLRLPTKEEQEEHAQKAESILLGFGGLVTLQVHAPLDYLGQIVIEDNRLSPLPGQPIHIGKTRQNDCLSIQPALGHEK